jgi:hypothetical protein
MYLLKRRNGIGQINGSRLKRVRRSMSNKIHIGTWNVKTLLRPGKMQELAEELMKIKNWTVCIQDHSKWIDCR